MPRILGSQKARELYFLPDKFKAPEAEQTLSYLSQTFGAPSNTYSLIANSDIPWPTITLSDGDEARIDAQGYGKVLVTGGSATLSTRLASALAPKLASLTK